jgi:hypothetical protein
MTWKAVERKIAELLGGRRVPITGRQRGDAPDIQHDFFSIEVKHRQSLPGWILEGMEQAKMSNPGDKYPLVVLHQKGMKFTESLAILELRDIIKLKNRLDEHNMSEHEWTDHDAEARKLVQVIIKQIEENTKVITESDHERITRQEEEADKKEATDEK